VQEGEKGEKGQEAKGRMSGKTTSGGCEVCCRIKMVLIHWLILRVCEFEKNILLGGMQVLMFFSPAQPYLWGDKVGAETW
jgi:hypothetical protein